MGLFRRKKRKKLIEAHTVSAWLRQTAAPLADYVARRYRTRGYRRLANRWIRHNPKRTLALFWLAMALIWGGDITLSHILTEHRERQAHSTPDVTGQFSAMGRIYDNQREINHRVKALAAYGERLVQVRDSLQRLESKTPSDSAAIRAIDTKLKKINRQS